MFTAVSFRHHSSRNQSVFQNQVRDSGKLPAIPYRILEQPFHHFVIHRFLTGIDDALQEQVRFFQLVIEEIIILRELHFLQTVFGYHLRTKHIQPRKQPATSRLFLVGNAYRNHLIGKVRVKISQALLVTGQHSQRSARHCVMDCLVGSSMLVGALNLLQHICRDSPLLCLCA